MKYREKTGVEIMRKSVKIAIGLVLVCGFIAITSSHLITPTSSVLPYERDPDDPGNSPGPGLGSIPTDDNIFELVEEDTLINYINILS